MDTKDYSEISTDYADVVRKMKTSELMRLSRDRLALLDTIADSDEMGLGRLAPLERAALQAVEDEIDRRIPIPEDRTPPPATSIPGPGVEHRHG
jgi:hypothetical protein